MHLTLSRTGPPREGFEYQDLHGVLVLLDWLAHPSTYEWVKFEAREYGSLDDFAVCYPNRHLRLYQVKHTGETPARPVFTFDDLTDLPPRGRRSLFEKWYRSWIQSTKRGVFTSITAILKTNKPPSPEMLALTRAEGSGRVFNVAHLKTARPDLYTRLTDLAGKRSKTTVDRFLHALRFEFDLPDIPVLRELAEERCRGLSLSPGACRDLEDEVWSWAKRGTEITLADIKRACHWFQPRALEERFPIPPDYVPLGGGVLKELTDVIDETPGGGLRVVVGAPGSGKSTLLEDLYDGLSQKKISCVRHHYYIPGIDRFNRLKFEDAAGALIHELERSVPAAMPAVNPVPERLKNILDAVSAHLQSKNHSLVIILDGLDHVVRDEDEKELLDLLRNLLPSRPGLWFVLGTRDFPSSSRIALLLEEHAARETWITMPRFNRNECAELLSFHRSELRLTHDHHFDEVVSAFFKVTAGYPLHARYVITRLKQLAANGILLASDIDNIEPFGGDVPGLYRQIWRALPSTAQSAAILLAVAQFEMDGAEITSALRSVSASDALNGITAIRPFLEEGTEGFQFFHSSFAEFVKSTDAYQSLAGRLRRDLIYWLEHEAQESKQWTWLLRKKAEDGDTEPLIATTTRSWIIESFHNARDSSQIISTLELASSVAMVSDDYGRAFSRGQYAVYIANSLQFFEREWNRLDLLNRRRLSGSALQAANAEILYRDSDFLVELARDADAKADRPLIRRILDELNGRLFSGRRQSLAGGGQDMKNSVACLLRVAALLRERTSRATRFIKNLNAAYRAVAAESFASELVRSGQRIAFHEFINSRDLLSPLASAAANAGALAAFHRNLILDGDYTRSGVWLRIQQALANNSSPSRIRMPKSKEIPLTLADYDTKGQEALTELYQGLFSQALLATLEGKAYVAERWAKRTKGAWGHEAARLIAKLAIQCGSALKDRRPLEPDALREFNSLRALAFGRDREIWGFRTSLRAALMQILGISLTLLHDITGDTVGAQRLGELCDLALFNDYSVTELMNTLPSRVLQVDDTRAWISQQTQKWNSLVEQFPERAEAYLMLASLGMKINDPKLGAELIKEAIENMLSYGNHKDLFLLETIEAIESCGTVAATTQMRDWFRRVAPIANSVASFTDGDETSRLAVDFGETLAAFDKFAAFREYVDLTLEERLHLAESVFATLIPRLNLTDPFEYAIAKTCTDYESREELSKLATMGSAEALRAQNELDAKYGLRQIPEQTTGWVPEEEKEPNIEETGPDKIHELLWSLKYSSNRAAFIEKWLPVWMKNDGEAAYSALKPWLDKDQRAAFDADIVVHALPYVSQFEGSERAFSMLCDVHRSSYGWSRFFTSSRVVEGVFGFLQREYPNRWREFIHCTLKGKRNETHGMLPVPVGTRFLVRFGAGNEAVTHCEAAVKTLEELTQAAPLPPVQWVDHPATALDVLFTRLFWISPVVREQTALVLSDLLQVPTCSDVLFSRFLARLRDERLDSRVVVLLTPLARAARHGFRADIAALTAAIRMRSAPVRALLEAIEVVS
jgi:hypothetical protein